MSFFGIFFFGFLKIWASPTQPDLGFYACFFGYPLRLARQPVGPPPHGPQTPEGEGVLPALFSSQLARPRVSLRNALVDWTSNFRKYILNNRQRSVFFFVTGRGGGRSWQCSAHPSDILGKDDALGGDLYLQHWSPVPL